MLDRGGWAADEGGMTINAAADLSEMNLKSAVSVSVARKSLDQAERQGEAAVQLIEAAASVAKGGSGNPPGIGGRLDVVG